MTLDIIDITTIKVSEKFQDYNKGQILGRGSCGVVHLVERKSDGQAFAMKQLANHDMSDNDKNDIIKKVHLYSLLDHPNILKVIDFFKTSEGAIYGVLEYANGGDLQ